MDQTTPLTTAPFDNDGQLCDEFNADYLEYLLDTPSLPLNIDPLLQTGYPLNTPSTEMESLTNDDSPRSDSSEKCSCRIRLLRLPSNMQPAAGTNQLDEIYKATDDVINYLKDIMFCTKCQRSLADLVCIISIFQETGKSWEKLLQVEGFSTVKVTVGGREVEVSDHNCIGRILVMDLVTQAEALLDATQSTVEKMGLLQPQPHFLDKVNVTYLNTITGHLRDLFCRVRGAMEDPLA